MLLEERSFKLAQIRTIDPNTYTSAPLWASIFVDVDETGGFHEQPESYLAIMRKDPAVAGRGRHIANLAGAPTATESDTRVNSFEDVYGATGDILGQEQLRMTRMEVAFSMISLTLENKKLLRPDVVMEEIQGEDAVAASLIVGSGNSAFTLTAKSAGVSANAIRIALVDPAAASAALSVTVSASDITVNLATDGTGIITSTAAQVRDAINASAEASTLVTASLPSTSDGTGVVAAQAMTNLTGGADGTVVGVRTRRRGFIALTDYVKNMVLVWSTSDRTVAGAWVLRHVINVNEDREYSFEDEGTAFGVEGNFRCHSTGESMDPETGLIRVNFDELDWTTEAIPS